MTAGEPREGVRCADPDLVGLVAQQFDGASEPFVGGAVPIVLGASVRQLLPTAFQRVSLGVQLLSPLVQHLPLLLHPATTVLSHNA